jgi:hypothetical protein
MISVRVYRARAIASLLLLMCFNSASAQQHPSRRNALADSIAWVPQNLPIPGIVAGNAIWFDFNNDGRLDILMAGMSESGPVSGIYRNDSASFANVHAEICPIISERGLAWGDIDNDGDLDFAVQGSLDTSHNQPASRVYRSDSGTFVNMNAQIMDLSGGAVNRVDYDNDGRLDLFINGSPDLGGSFASKLYRIIGGKFYEDPMPFPGVWGSSVSWADYDNDGFVDVVISGYGWGAQTRLFHNAMSQGVVGFDEVYAPVEGTSGFRAVNSGGLIWFDYDNDGFQDLLVTGAGYGGSVGTIYHNDQNGTFTEIRTTLKPVSVSAVAAGDYDNDGFADIAVSGADDFTTGSNPTTKIYHNDGNGIFSDIGAVLEGTWFGSLDWGDFDGDGRLDLLVTGATLPRTHPTYGGDLRPVTLLYRNTVLVSGNASPSTPQGLATQVASGGTTFTWNASTDGETDQKAITYNIRVGTTPGGIDIVSPLSNISSGFRRLPKPGRQGTRTSATLRNLAPGTYYWSVQAVDHECAGSSFSEMKTFTISPTSATGTPELPLECSLGQNYPNPFNPTTTINYQISHSSHVALTVCDMLGREVAMLVNGKKEAGNYAVRFDATRLASGVYFYRLRAGDFVQSRTMLLLK